MIRITIESIPHGDENKKRKYCEIDISREGANPFATIADFKVEARGQIIDGGWDDWAGFPVMFKHPMPTRYEDVAKVAMDIVANTPINQK